jgi:hypothetical protein
MYVLLLFRPHWVLDLRCILSIVMMVLPCFLSTECLLPCFSYLGCDVGSLSNSKRKGESRWQEYRNVKKLVKSWYKCQNEASCSEQCVNLPCAVSQDIPDSSSSNCISLADVFSTTDNFSPQQRIENVNKDPSIERCLSEASDTDNNWDVESEIDARLDILGSDLAESDGVDSYDDFDLLEDLWNWTNDYKVTTTAVDTLLKILHNCHANLPLTCRTLMKSKSSSCQVVALTSGQYIHFRVLNGLLQFRDQLLASNSSVIYYRRIATV